VAGRRPTGQADPLAELIGDSPGMAALRETITRLLHHQPDGRRFPPLLIHGETGAGKGLVARMIHRAGPRAAGPFVDINCAAIPETLLEAELFGFERGAFTDAKQAKVGLFQAANHGTIFLDEVGLLPEGLQAKLLKVLEERSIRRLGGTRNEPVDVWILTATNEDLAIATREKRFREDLYHRLAVMTLRVPPLRERGRDILLLAEHFLKRACDEYHLPPKTFAADATAALQSYSWPGNVRELSNVMERVVLLSEGQAVTARMLGLPEPGRPEPSEPKPEPEAVALKDAVANVERARLLDALHQTNWNITRAAATLGVSRDTLRYRIQKHDLRPQTPLPRRPRQTRRPEGAPTASPAEPPAAPAPAVPAAPPPAPPPAAVPAATAPALGSVRWEQRRLTLLRAALVLPPESDPSLYASRAVEALVEKVRNFGGRVEELSPTGVVAAFGLEPVEDAPRRAAHAAMAIQKAAERARQGGPERLAVKVGIHVGQIMVGRASGTIEIALDAKRQAWTILDALIARAETGTNLISEAAAPFLERRFELAPIGRPELGPGRAYRLGGHERTGLRFGRRMTTFVGRHREMELLRNCLDATLRGHGQVVGVGGEAGIGKSRLLFEFRQSLAGEPVTVLRGRCLSYGGDIPYFPILDMFRRHYRITESDPPEAITEKVRLLLHFVGLDPDEWAPYLIRLLGVQEPTEQLAMLSPEAIRSRTLETLRRMGLKGSGIRPCIYMMEDLQWVDRTSEQCFSTLVDSLAGARIMFLCTYRPGYHPPWMEKSYATQISLQPLSPEDSLTVVRSVLQTAQVPEPLATLILDKAEGNPFFLEEVARSVGELGDLHPTLAVPDTIQEVLLARINRLSDESKRVLQAASVLGREVPLRLLGAIWQGSGPLDPHLRELTRLEFLYERTEAAEPMHVFTNALTQEVAYESLPPSDRKGFHGSAGLALEALYADRVGEVVDRLAYHYSRSEKADKAIEYLTRVAEKAARGHAHTEAFGVLRDALSHVERLPTGNRDRFRLGLVLRQASSLIYLGRFQETVELLSRHREALDRLQNPDLSGQYHFLLGRAHLFLGDSERAVQSAERSIAEASRCDDLATLGKAHYLLAQEAPLSGQAKRGIEHGRRALTLLEPTGQPWWIGQAHWVVGLNYAQMGEFGAALESEAKAQEIGESVGDRQLQTSAAWATGVVRAAMGDGQAAIEACEEGMKKAPDPLSSVVASGWLGYAYLESGDAARAIPLLEQSVRLFGQFRFAQFQGWFTICLAEAYRANGEVERAHELATRGLAITKQAKTPYGLGWAHRALGRIAHARGALQNAETHFTEALKTFTSIHARYDLGRTHLNMARLAHDKGNREGVAAHLGDAHRLFSDLRIPKYVERTEQLSHALGSTPFPS
jgi:DNA-binding NtrC family response regulator/tetratricopeptide (TPR) repeat protein